MVPYGSAMLKLVEVDWALDNNRSGESRAEYEAFIVVVVVVVDS